MEDTKIWRKLQFLLSGIQSTIEILRELGHKDSEIKDAIMGKYSFSSEKAEEYLKNSTSLQH